MPRSRPRWKGYFINNFIQSNKIFLRKRKKVIWARNSVIPQKFIGHTVFVHNGKSFLKVFITKERVGHKFGEFSVTRKFTQKYEKVKLQSKRKK